MAVRTEFPQVWTPPPFRPSPGRGPIPRGSGVVGFDGPSDTIGNITLLVSPPTGNVAVGQRVTITAIRTGGGAPLTYAWAGPPGTSAPITSTSSSISWIAEATDSGTYTVTVSSAGAIDSPKNASTTITVTAPPVADRFLMESDGFILMEDGSYILLET